MTTAKKTTATTTKPATAKNAKKKPAAQPTAETKPEPETETAPKTVATTETAKTETPVTEEKKPTTPGVRAMKTRPYIAGVIIAKHGLAAGVTNEMVAELDEQYGHANPAESLFCLRNAWHSARGYVGIDATNTSIE